MTWKDYVLLAALAGFCLTANNVAWFWFVHSNYPTMTTHLQQVGRQVGGVILNELQKQGVQSPAGPGKPAGPKGGG